MKKILLIGTAREKSTRVKNKMTRPFGGTTLFEIYLKKLEKISEMDNPFSDIAMAVCRSDKILWEMTRNAKIQVVERDLFERMKKRG